MAPVALLASCLAALAGSPEGSVETDANRPDRPNIEVESSEPRFHWGLEG